MKVLNSKIKRGVVQWLGYSLVLKSKMILNTSELDPRAVQSKTFHAGLDTLILRNY